MTVAACAACSLRPPTHPVRPRKPATSAACRRWRPRSTRGPGPAGCTSPARRSSSIPGLRPGAAALARPPAGLAPGRRPRVSPARSDPLADRAGARPSEETGPELTSVPWPDDRPAPRRSSCPCPPAPPSPPTSTPTCATVLATSRPGRAARPEQRDRAACAGCHRGRRARGPRRRGQPAGDAQPHRRAVRRIDPELAPVGARRPSRSVAAQAAGVIGTAAGDTARRAGADRGVREDPRRSHPAGPRRVGGRRGRPRSAATGRAPDPCRRLGAVPLGRPRREGRHPVRHLPGGRGPRGRRDRRAGRSAHQRMERRRPRRVTSFLPGCGRCRWCASGMQNLCDSGADTTAGCRSRRQLSDVPRRRAGRTVRRCRHVQPVDDDLACSRR